MSNHYEKCDNCEIGYRKKPYPPKGGDYTEDGRVLKFCINCGYSNKYTLMGFTPPQTISKRKIKKVVDIVFTRQHLPYPDKKELLRQIFDDNKTKNEIIFFIHITCGEDIDFLKDKIL